MKLTDLNTTTLYEFGRYHDQARVLDANKVYVPRSQWSHDKSPHQPRAATFKPTHILVMTKYRYGENTASFDEALEYTLEQYQEGVEPPAGWRVETATPAQVRQPWADYLEATRLGEIARKKHAEQSNELDKAAQDLAARAVYALREMGIESKPTQSYSRYTISRPDAVLISLDQLEQLEALWNRMMG